MAFGLHLVREALEVVAIHTNMHTISDLFMPYRSLPLHPLPNP